VNVDFPEWMIHSLDREANRLGVTPAARLLRTHLDRNRATGVAVRSWLTFGRNSEFPKDKDQNPESESESGIRNSEIRTRAPLMRRGTDHQNEERKPESMGRIRTGEEPEQWARV
jgi:hypothetical protein